MKINADFEHPVIMDTQSMNWVSSPAAGVQRRMLDRIGDEVARATTIVRFAAGSQFSQHSHEGGEEFIVLEGVFQDEHGDFPAGSYVRNPPTTSHTPSSQQGCTIFVKLWQFDPDDRTQVMLDTNKSEPVPAAGRSGVRVLPLYKDNRETVRLEHWDKGARVVIDLPQGGEFLVLNGKIETNGQTLGQHAWMRLPCGSQLDAVSVVANTQVWMKLGHMPFAQSPHL